MQFKEWLTVNESVVVQGPRGEAVLGKAKENGKMVEFSYSAGDYYSSFQVWPFAENRPGYLQAPATGFDPRPSMLAATVIGVIKTTPLEPGNGADRAFINALTASLKNGRPSIPYREGESDWMGVLKGAGVDDEKFLKGLKGDKDLSDTSTPAMGTASSNMTKAGKSISFNKTSGSWAYFFETQAGHTDFHIDAVVNMMKKAAQPLVDNDIIEHYRIVRGWNYRDAETVWSGKGKQEYDDRHAFIKKSAAYMKFLAEKMLANHPKAKEGVLKRFRNSWDKDVKPENTKVPLDRLQDYVRSHHQESPFLGFFLDALKGDNQQMYDVMDDAAKTPDEDDAIARYKEISEDEYHRIVENPRLFIRDAFSTLFFSDLLSKHASGNFERFKRELKEAVNDWLASGKDITAYDIEYLKKIGDYIDIRGKEQIDDAHEKIKKREEEQKRKQEEDEARKESLIARGNFKYIVLGQKERWSEVPFKYLDGDEVDVGELAGDEEIVDKESIFQAAHEKASEDAWANAEEKKSETYGQDRKEVESDIDYEWDEYVEDRFEEDAWEGTSEEEAKKEIKDEYWDDFVAWKVERLKKEEEEESWKYEPEPEESDIWKIEKSMTKEQAYEDGLVVVRWADDSDEIEVDTHSKHFEKAKEEVAKALALSMSEKDEDGDPLVRRWTRVAFNLVDSEELKRFQAGEL